MELKNMLKPLDSMTLGEAAAAMGATLDGAGPQAAFGPVCSDTRTLMPDNIFLALRGERFDGHLYCAQAFENGAAAAIVDRAFERPEQGRGWPLLRVDDTLAAYGDLAAQRRRQWGGPVLAISGSCGKTTTRRLVASALAPYRSVLEPQRNFNNLIGVPSTLLRLEPQHEVMVAELGMNQPGELARLTRIAQPTAALLTQIGLTHVGMFSGEEELTRAKLDLFLNCSPDVPLVVNAACERTTRGLERLGLPNPVIPFCGQIIHSNREGCRRAQVWVDNVEFLAPVGYRFDLVLPEGRLEGLELRYFGRHQLANVAAAAALLMAGGYEPAWVARALERFESEPLRGQILLSNDLTFILDCYNASPPSMSSALVSLGDVKLKARRLVLVLADMLELGPEAPAAHFGLIEPIELLQPAAFFGLGPHCAAVARELDRAGLHAAGYERRDDLIEGLEAYLQPGDLVFFKGSHGFGLERVAQALAPELVIG